MPEKTLIEAVRDTMAEVMREDERVVVMGEDVGPKGGVFLATDGLHKEFGDERVIDTPLAESAIVGVAIGAAVNGLLPIAEIQFADFIWPAADQIISEAARIRYRSNGDFGCPIVIRAPYGGGVHGALYHSQSVEAYFAHCPGLKVVCPSFPDDAKGMLREAIYDPDPVLFFEHKKLYRSIKGEVPDGDTRVPIGKARVVREGTDVTVFAYGLMLHHTIEAAEKLQAQGVSVNIVDLRTIKPLDKPAILENAAKTGKVVIVHEDNLTGGIGGEVAAIIAEEAFDSLDGPIVRIAGPDVPAMPFAKTLEAAFLPSVDRIVEGIQKLAAY
ncbi:MAG: alpha-ketoacid dehydrogenase subunit beta [Candidatus Dormibacteria bacterium]